MCLSRCGRQSSRFSLRFVRLIKAQVILLNAVAPNAIQIKVQETFGDRVSLQTGSQPVNKHSVSWNETKTAQASSHLQPPIKSLEDHWYIPFLRCYSLFLLIMADIQMHMRSQLSMKFQVDDRMQGNFFEKPVRLSVRIVRPRLYLCLDASQVCCTACKFVLAGPYWLLLLLVERPSCPEQGS